jgi:hypothetical protein
MGMRNVLWAIAFVAASVAPPAFAQLPPGFELFYNGPTNVNLAGRPVTADIALYADLPAAKRGDLRIALRTDVTGFIEQTEQDLENWVATHRSDCGERWSAGEPYIGFPAGAIRFRIDIDLEYWTCGLDGKGEPSRLAHESGTVDVTLKPYVADGKLQASVSAFSIDVKTGVTKYLPLEFVVRRMVDAELKKLNQNRKFYRSPNPLFAEGFAYESIAAAKTPEDHVIITAHYKAKGSSDAFKRIAAKMRTDGITQ